MDVFGGLIAAGNNQIAAPRGARADEDRVPVLCQQSLETVDTLAGAEFDTEVENIAAFLVDDGVGQAEFRDLSPDHAAGFWVLVENHAGVTEGGKIARNGEGGRAAADQCDTLAVFL